MAKREAIKDKAIPRGIYERVPGSGVWWIHYQVDGVRRRESVGRQSDAIALYQTRKADARRGMKLPELRTSNKTTVSDLIDLVLTHTQDHKDAKGYVSKAKIIREGLGNREAAALEPIDIEQWLRERTRTPATYNRYKSFLSLAYRLALRSPKMKLDKNPARDAEHRKEPGGRERFLSYEEYETLRSVVEGHFPEHLAEFVLSVHTGMRLGEQYRCEWGWFDEARALIRLPAWVTKNKKPRNVHLNKDALGAVLSVRQKGAKKTDKIFPRNTEKNFSNHSWFEICLNEAGIEDYVWHSNRHTFCSWLAMAGATTTEIMHAGGHLGPAMAARYSHLSPDANKSVVHRIERR